MIASNVRIPMINIYSNHESYRTAEIIAQSIEENNIPFEIVETEGKFNELAIKHAEENICGTAVSIDGTVKIYSDKRNVKTPLLEYEIHTDSDEKRLRCIGDNIARLILNKELLEV